MVQGKRFFTAVMLTVLLFGGLVKAQKDFISNQNDFGSYVGGQGKQNVIINNTLNRPLLFAPGTENLIQDSTKSNANFIGGALNEITTSGENALDAYNLLYGNGNSLNNSTSTGLIGHVNSSEYVTASAALGSGNTLAGNSNLTPGQDDLPQLFAIGTDNFIDEGNENVAIGTNNSIEFSSNSFALGGNNNIIEGENCGAIGQGNLVESNSNNAYSLGAFTRQRDKDRSLVLGFGSPNIGDRLTSVGDRSITIGTNIQGGRGFNTLNIRPPSSNGDFVAPLVGIGTPDPDAKLNIVNRGATGGESNSAGVALRVERFIEDNDNEPLFNVRDNGAAGFNLPAKASPRAPYQFEESGLTPAGFPTGQGQANIVQNYNSFPFFQSTGPSENTAKWLALGERPPGDGTKQVAYGLANVWNNAAGNFVLLDQTQQDQEETDPDVKDLAITFQDVGPNGDLTDDGGRNRIRFLFRNSQPIEGDPTTPASDDAIYELMSLEPTGEVGVGDYTNSTQQANLEVKADTQNTLSPIFQVRRNGSDSTRGDDVFTVSDSGFVGINRTSVISTGNTPAVDLTVQGDAEKFGGNSWINLSDRRLKKDIKPFKDGLKTLMDINPVWYKYNGKLNSSTKGKHVGVIAQEMKEVAPYMVIENDNGYYSYDANALWYILVNAVQEQQKQLKEEQAENDSMRQALKNQQEQLDNQQKQIDQLRERLNRLAQQKDGNANRFKKSNNLNEKTVSISAEDNQNQAMLLQNRPNPYIGETIIPYYLPETFDNASMLITNTNGQIIKRIDLENAGKGELTLRTEGLKAGQYLYSLIVNGRKIQTRKMVLKNNR